MIALKPILARCRYHLMLILIGLLWMEAFRLLTQIDIQGIIYYDSASYLNSAKNLYYFRTGHAYRPILMALINGIPYLFGFSDSGIYSFSFYVNVFCWLATSVILFEILKEFLTSEYAFTFALASVFIIGNVAFIFHLLTENIFLLFIMFGFYLLVGYYKNNQFRYLSISLSIFILSMLVKPGAKLLGIAFTLFFIREIVKNYKSRFAWFIYGSVFMVLVQCAGIKYQFGNFTVSYIDAVTYYDYLGAKTIALKTNNEYKEVWKKRVHYIFSLDAPKQKEVAFEDFKNGLQYNTEILAKAYFLNLLENGSTSSTCITDCKNVKNDVNFPAFKRFLAGISKWQNIVFSIVGLMLGLYYLYRIRLEKPYGLIAFFILSTIILSGISFNEGDRFHVVTFPFVIILAGKFISDRRNGKLKHQTVL